MGFLDSVRSWFRTEAAEVSDLGRQTKGRLESELDRREADLNLTPQQRLERIQEQIEQDNGFAALQEKIQGREALADATSDVAKLDQTPDDGDVDVDGGVMDLASEEVTPPDQP